MAPEIVISSTKVIVSLCIVRFYADSRFIGLQCLKMTAKFGITVADIKPRPRRLLIDLDNFFKAIESLFVPAGPDKSDTILI